MKIIIDDIPASQNQVYNWHWAKRKEYKDYWETLVWAEIKNQKLQKINGQVEIEITFCFRTKRLYDFDNLLGGCKGLFDGLKQHLIKDDNIDIIKSLKLMSKRVGRECKKDYTEIEIEKYIDKNKEKL